MRIWRLTTTVKINGAGRAVALCLGLLLSFVAALPGAEIINRADLEFIFPGGPTNRLTSEPVRTVSQSAPASQINFFDAAFGLVVTNAILGQPLFVQAA